MILRLHLKSTVDGDWNAFDFDLFVLIQETWSKFRLGQLCQLRKETKRSIIIRIRLIYDNIFIRIFCFSHLSFFKLLYIFTLLSNKK